MDCENSIIDCYFVSIMEKGTLIKRIMGLDVRKEEEEEEDGGRITGMK